MKELSWKPRRSGVAGEVYCSPACGAKCSRSDFETATARANALVLRLGGGWKPRVWENFGWHFCAVKNGLKVHPPKYSRDYTAFLSGDSGAGGRWVADGRTPRAAIKKVLSYATEERNEIDNILQKAGGAQ